MPTYEYQCGCGKVSEAVFKMNEKPAVITCDCGGEAKKILSAGMVIGDDMPAWMRHKHVRGCLQNPFEKPIQTRSEYNKLLKTRGIAEISAGREI